ncbi:unannotated protein [freshwater metagenome]|uniref:Unannotated protein n=1 Tax=freshwater metagenome TaxID=449393 RepID=A0A6J7DRJ1_9ZZZZ|nr:AMP-binding protein [Actinomycetota bacterium]
MEQTSQRELRTVDPTWTLAELMAHLTQAVTSKGPALALTHSQNKFVEPEVSLVVSTSGTTGINKEVLISASALVATAQASNKYLGAKTGQKWSLLLPLTHIAGINVLMRSIELESEPIDLRNVKGIYPQADFTAIVPTQLYRALNGEGDLLEHLKKAKAVLIGGGKLSSQLRSQAQDAGIKVVESYGMTETTGGCVYDGKVLEGTSLEIGTDGRIRISGSCLASGYLGRENLWQQSFDGRWFTTSDLGKIVDGKLKVSSRTDDIVVSGGENISLVAIENAIANEFPKINVAAFAIPDSEWGSAIHIAIAGEKIAEESIQVVLQASLGRASKAKAIHFLDRIPVGALGKVDREKLIEMVEKK